MRFQPQAWFLSPGDYIIPGSKNPWILSFRKRQESARDTGTPLKGQHTKSRLESFILASGRGEVEWTRVVSGEPGVYGSLEKAEGTPARTSVLSPSPTPPMPSFLGGSLPSTRASRGKQQPHLLGPILPLPAGLHTLLRSQLPGPQCKRSVQTQGVSVTELCGFGARAISPTFP